MFTDVRRGAPPLQQLWEKTAVGKTKTLLKKNVTSHDRDCFFLTSDKHVRVRGQSTGSVGILSRLLLC